MTIEEFREDCTDFSDLIRYCSECNAEVLVEDLFSRDGVSEYVDENLSHLADEYGWRTIRDALDDVPTDGGWYLLTDYGILDFREADDDDFRELRDCLEERMAEWDLFDGDEEEGEEEDYNPDDRHIEATVVHNWYGGDEEEVPRPKYSEPEDIFDIEGEEALSALLSA